MNVRAKCPDCAAPIVWVEGPRGTVPLDAKPVDAYQVVWSDRDVDPIVDLVSVRHQHRCPNPRRVKGGHRVNV